MTARRAASCVRGSAAPSSQAAPTVNTASRTRNRTSRNSPRISKFFPVEFSPCPPNRENSTGKRLLLPEHQPPDLREGQVAVGQQCVVEALPRVVRPGPALVLLAEFENHALAGRSEEHTSELQSREKIV